MFVCYFLLSAGLPSSRTGTEPLLGVQRETEVLRRAVLLSVRQRGAAVPRAGASTGHQPPLLGCVPQQHVAQVCFTKRLEASSVLIRFVILLC